MNKCQDIAAPVTLLRRLLGKKMRQIVSTFFHKFSECDSLESRFLPRTALRAVTHDLVVSDEGPRT